MKLLLTSSGINNTSIHDALVDLLGKPTAESSALCIPTGVQPFPGGPSHVYQFISGTTFSPMCGLGWKSLGVLELTALGQPRRKCSEPLHARKVDGAHASERSFTVPRLLS